jgi:teichuronic acid biosynthesis glycosyltransferase TuaH
MDIILIARDTWGDVWRRRQFLTAEFARAGHRVLFVEAPYSLPRLLAGSADMKSRPRNRMWDAFTAPRCVSENIYVTAPPKPLPNHPAEAVNRALQAAHLRRAAHTLRMKRPVLWINPESAAWLPGALAHSLAVYDVTDDWTEAASLPSRERAEIRSNDRLMLARADLVFTVSHDLFEKKWPFNPNTVFMPNGVQPEAYDILHAPRPAELDGLQGPIAGYTGTLHTDRLDLDLIEAVARAGDVSQVFVGPNHLDPAAARRLAALPRVRLVPAQPWRRLPEFVFHFDVCSIPHAVTPFTHSLDPIKAYEYLAAGKPIVAVAVRGLEPLRDFIALAADRDDYLRLLRHAVEHGPVRPPEILKQEGRRHAWSARARDILDHIQRTLDEKHTGAHRSKF